MGIGITLLLFAAANAKVPPGEIMLVKSCATCHTLDAIRARNLSRSDWSLEVDKMVAMGAKIGNRKALLDYLAKAYGPRR